MKKAKKTAKKATKKAVRKAMVVKATMPKKIPMMGPGTEWRLEPLVVPKKKPASKVRVRFLRQVELDRDVFNRDQVAEFSDSMAQLLVDSGIAVQDAD